MSGGFLPWELAVADQELARFSGLLGELVDRRRALEVGFELLDFDFLDRIAAFMVGDVRPRLDENGLLAVVALAVDRIVRLEDRLGDQVGRGMDSVASAGQSDSSNDVSNMTTDVLMRGCEVACGLWRAKSDDPSIHEAPLSAYAKSALSWLRAAADRLESEAA